MPTPKSHSILEEVAVTWKDIEPAILAFAACGIDFGIRGTHGNAKTTVATIIARALGTDNPNDSGVRIVQADKCNIMSLAGLPDLEESRKKGETTFIPNKRTLIGPVEVVLIDELTRAPKESQNYLLEVIESKTLLGHKLTHKLCIASFNPDTYKGAVKLDAALLDRFAAIVPVSTFEDLDNDQIERMIDGNLKRFMNDAAIQNGVVKKVKEAIVKIRTVYDGYLNNPDTLEKVKGYLTQFLSLAIPQIKSLDPKNTLSGREIGKHLSRSLLALAAYYQAILGRQEPNALEEASDEIIAYCIITKHAMESAIQQKLRAIQSDCKYMLRATAKGEAGKIQMAFGKALSIVSKVQFWKDKAADVIKHLQETERMDMMEATLSKIVEEERNISAEKAKDGAANKTKAEKLHNLLKAKAELFGVTSAYKEFEDITDRVEGALICDVVAAMQNANVSLTKEPYLTTLGKASITTNDIVDLLVHIRSKEGVGV